MQSLMLKSVCKISFRVTNHTWKCSFHAINLHAPLSMGGFCRIARYGWCLQGVVDVLTLNNYPFLLFYRFYFKPQCCRVIKKEKSEKPVSRREYALKGACFFFFFLQFLIHPVVHHHTLSFSISPFFIFFISHLYLIEGEFAVHQCGPVWKVAAFRHRCFIMYEHGRSADLRQDVQRCYLTSISPDTVQA